MSEKDELDALWGFPLGESTYQAVMSAREIVLSKDTQTPVRNLNKLVASTVNALADEGLVAYYHEPMKIVPLNAVLKRIADAGVATVKQAIHIIVRAVFKSRPQEELAMLTVYLDNMLWQHPQTSVWYVCFPLGQRLHQQARDVMAKVRAHEADGETVGAVLMEPIVHAIEALVKKGIEYYYRRPADMLRLGGFTRKVADGAIDTADKAIDSMIHRIITKRSHDELLVLCDYVETLLHDLDE